ncbi:MAG: hypothetical protein ACYSSP_09870 [Planctomycetota bacterium]
MVKLVSFRCFMFFVILIVLFFFSGLGFADRRAYVWTYEYMTMPKGMSEIEYYLTLKVPDYHNYDDKNIWEHQLEYEYGVTDRFDVAVYQRWQNTNTKDEDKFEYTGTKLRTRYRLAEKGVYPLDTLLYLEYIRPDSSGETQFLEGKLVLAKDVGKVNFAYNQIVKTPIKNGGKTENEYAAGIGYELNPVWKFGIESKGNFTEDKFYLGPTVSWASEKIWFTIGAARGLNDRSDDILARFIVGFPL